MKKFLASLNKELTQLYRDRAGMAILFIMPMALIIIMVAVQDVPFSDFQEKKIKMLIYDADGDSLGMAISKGIEKNDFFEITLKSESIATSALQKEVVNGGYKVGLIIGKGSTAKLRERLQSFIAATLNGEKVEQGSSKDSGQVQIVFDPVIKQSFRSTVTNNIEKHLSRIELKIMLDIFQSQLKDLLPDIGSLSLGNEPMVSLVEKTESPTSLGGSDRFNAVQHNVPGYTVFGMFFIVITLAANIIRERDDGSDLRLQLIPHSFWHSRLGRIIAYVTVTFFQAIFMLGLGLTVLPWLGYPTLNIGQNLLPVFAVILVTGLAACGFGMMVGTIFNTHQQAAVFGAVSVVIMSALGGVWVPIFVMPEIMQSISSLFPVGWSLEAFNNLFLRDGSWSEVTNSLILLTLFFIATMLVTRGAEKYKRSLN